MTRLCCCFVILLTWAGADAAWSQSIVVLPAESRLDGPDARQALLIQRVREGVLREPVADGATWSTSNESVAVVEQGVVTPRGNGMAVLTVSTNEGETASARVEVAGMQRQTPAWSFQNHVQPVLAKAGCNSGACHGALAGKGGFKLSLRGYDSDADYRVITQQSHGRRIELTDPGAVCCWPNPPPRCRTAAACVWKSARPTTACSPSGSPPARPGQAAKTRSYKRWKSFQQPALARGNHAALDRSRTL